MEDMYFRPNDVKPSVIRTDNKPLHGVLSSYRFLKKQRLGVKKTSFEFIQVIQDINKITLRERVCKK